MRVPEMEDAGTDILHPRCPGGCGYRGWRTGYLGWRREHVGTPPAPCAHPRAGGMRPPSLLRLRPCCFTPPLHRGKWGGASGGKVGFSPPSPLPSRGWRLNPEWRVKVGRGLSDTPTKAEGSPGTCLRPPHPPQRRAVTSGNVSLLLTAAKGKWPRTPLVPRNSPEGGGRGGGGGSKKRRRGEKRTRKSLDWSQTGSGLQQ